MDTKGFVFNIIEMANRFFNKILFQDGNVMADKDSQKYWKNRIFYMVAVAMITLGAPVLFYGAYMFYKQGETTYGRIEVLTYILMVIVITRRSLSVKSRSLFITLILYLISLLLLITTGLVGGGMVCILLSLILAGCLLDKKQIFQVVTVNIIILVMVTTLLMYGYLDGTVIGAYKNVWLINVIMAQVGGVVLIFIMNTIYNGLEKQTQLAKKSEELFIANDTKYKAMIANIADVIVVVDESGIFKYNSNNLTQKLGWVSEDISSKPLWEEIHPEDQNYIQGELQDLLDVDGLKKTMEARYIYKKKSIRYLELTAVNLVNDPDVNGVLINYHDITARKAREQRILNLVYQDSLTGLYNRRFFEKEKERLDIESQLPLSVITGDVNGLKRINDSLGHVHGDKLLVTIGKILTSCCRKDDIIARIGGDEFCILLPKTSSEVAAGIIKRISLACEEYNKNVSSELYYINISFGVATKTKMMESLDNAFKIAEDYMYKRKFLEARSSNSSIISSMKIALVDKSEETEEHTERLIKLSTAIGQVVGLTNQQFDELKLFASLHDIGKIGIDDEILNKAGKLTDLELVKMRKHSEVGYRIAMAFPELVCIADYILTYHERFDGTGYPQGLAGENIPLLSRILAIADAYDAMREDRAYRKAMSKQEAIEEIIKNSGTQFDPDISKIFIGILSNK